MSPSKLAWLILFLSFIYVSAEESWSWGSKNSELENESKQDTIEDINTGPNVVDEIIAKGRDGRMLAGFNEVYQDSDVREAISSANDSHARSLVQDRLCGLGLVSCDEEIEGKRPFIQPQDVIYAQPVHLKPVGRPIAAIPVKGSSAVGPYGPAKPVGPLYPSSPFGSSGLPPRPPSRPYKSPVGVGPVYSGSRPYPAYEPPLADTIDKKQVLAGPVANQGVQQHVHHHYHHADSEKIGVLDSQGPIYPSATGAVGGYDREVNSVGGGYGGADSYGGSSSFYKKELNLKGSASSNSFSASGYKDRYENTRADNGQDCVCVPYDQCLPHEVLQRKEDGYAIDPRNKQTNIEAIGSGDVVITDGNGTIVSIKKFEDTTEDVTEEKTKIIRRRRGSDLEARSERKITVDDLTSNGYKVEDPNSEKISGRKLSILGGSTTSSNDDDDEDNNRPLGLRIRPTFGVSFGLPSSGAGYPISPYGPNPAINPYGHSLGGGNGVNLGLVNVNPLLSLQVTKDEGGEKVLKPWVNLHVTPNHLLVDKFGHFVHKLKAPHYYGGPPPLYLPHHHNHFHTYPPPSPLPHFPSIHSYPSRPFYPERPYGSPYAPLYPGHGFHDHDEHDGPDGLDGSEYGPGGYGYDDETDDLESGLYRSANTSTNTAQYKRTSSQEQEEKTKSNSVVFPNDRSSSRRRRDAQEGVDNQRQGFAGSFNRCGPRQVCCRRPLRSQFTRPTTQCGNRNSQGINGRIKNPSHIDGDSEFGEYPWQAAILKKDPQESVYVCGGTLIDSLHVVTAAHCVKSYTAYDLRLRLGEWDVNHDVEFYPYIERDIVNLFIHPDFYAGTLFNDLAILRLDKAVDFSQHPHISPACLPDLGTDFSGQRCFTTGWGKDAFGEFGKYQNILKEVDVPVLSNSQCQSQLQQTRLGYEFKLHPGFVCAGGEEGKDACKGDGGGPMVCERSGIWQLVGVVSWGVGCGQYGVPGVYAKVAYYLDWIRQIINGY